MALTIRWRLTLWHTLALAVVLVGFALLVYGLVSHSLYRQIDRKLESSLAQMERDGRLAQQREARLGYWLDEFKEHDNLFGVVYGPDGSVVEKTPELAADAVPPRPQATAGEPRFRDTTVPVMGRQRVCEAVVTVGDAEYAVLLMASLADIDRELSDVRTALTTTVPLALALSAGLGYWLARKALAPMERLRSLTQEITADRLDRRLPVANPNDELGRMAGTINEMVARLERSFAEIRRFTADASHELRTPLTAIRTEAEVALHKPLSLPEHQQLLGSILEECERLTRLADQLLALAREDAGVARWECERIDLGKLLGGVADTMRPLAEAKRQRFEVGLGGPVTVCGDESRLRQVFYNLIENAIKYTLEGGAITLRLEWTGAAAVATVSDTGIGIPPEHLPHVFERFYRVDKARSRAEGGTGLGLSIARSIVSAHGGRIDLASDPGNGTTCTVTLPLNEAP